VQIFSRPNTLPVTEPVWTALNRTRRINPNYGKRQYTSQSLGIEQVATVMVTIACIAAPANIIPSYSPGGAHSFLGPRECAAETGLRSVHPSGHFEENASERRSHC